MMNVNDDESQSSYISEFDGEEESSVHSAADDLIVNKSNNSKSKKRKNIEENYLNHDERITRIKSVEQNTLQHNNKNNTTRSNSCQYKVSPTTIMFDCSNEGTYKCSHCSFSFCLQHGLQHQQDLKDEIRSLLTKTQELSANVDKLNFIYLKSSLITQVDQWATRMHEKVEQTRNELHCTLDQWEKKTEEKQDDVKTHLENDLEKSVDCVLRKQLKQFEINKQEVEKANQNLNLFENCFHSLNNQQLIKINIDAENEMILNPPTIICSDIIVDGLNLKENSPEKIDSSNQRTNKTFDNSSVETNSLSNLVAGESEDYLDIICPSTDTAMVTTNHYKTTDIVEKTDTEIEQNLPSADTNIFQKLFGEDMFKHADNTEILTKDVVSSVNNSQENELKSKD